MPRNKGGKKAIRVQRVPMLMNLSRATRVPVDRVIAGMTRPATNTNVESFAQTRMPTTMSRSELKSSYGTTENIALYHNGITGLGLTYPSQGLTSNSRLGDLIHIRRIKFKLLLQAEADRPNVNIRLTYITTTNSAFVTATDVYTSGCTMIAATNNDNMRVLYDTVLKIPTTTYQYTAGTSKVDSIVHWFELPINNRLGFRRGTTSPNVTHQLVVTAYDSIATLTTDIIARVSYTAEILFTDA